MIATGLSWAGFFEVVGATTIGCVLGQLLKLSFRKVARWGQ